jgi:hypothetical protein
MVVLEKIDSALETSVGALIVTTQKEAALGCSKDPSHASNSCQKKIYLYLLPPLTLDTYLHIL